jgi:protocatechuate 3,4-dioxygenase beta subunit
VSWHHSVLASLAAAGLGAVASAQAPPLIPTGPNVLLGRVLDVRADAAISGAIVTLFGDSPSNDAATGRPLPMPSRNVMTAADGHFVVRDLPAGRFTIAVRALGYVNSDFPTKVIELNDGDKRSPIVIRLWKHAAIGGRVIDERGEPVAGMPVHALQRVGSAGAVRLNSTGTAMTDDRGIYRLAQLAPGDYLVGVLSTTTTLPASVAGTLESSVANREAYNAATTELIQSGLARTWGCPECFASSSDGDRRGGFVLQRLGPTLPPGPRGETMGFANALYPGTSNPSEAAVITLESGESRTSIDIPIRFVPTVSISGVVSGPDGPARMMILRLTPPGVSLVDFDPPGMATAVTDAGGAFRILSVVPGDYTLRSARVDYFTRFQGRSLWSAQMLTVADSDIVGLDVILQSGVPVSGRSEFRGASGPLAGPLGVVHLQPLHAEMWRTVPAELQPDGTFKTGGDPRGRYFVNTVVPPGWFLQTVALAGRPVADEIIELDSAELTGLVLTFGQTTNRVAGTVTDAGGAPDPDTVVIVWPADSTIWREGMSLWSRRMRHVRATSKAAFDMATFAPGEYYVVAVPARQALNWQDPAFLQRLIPGATRITLGPEDSRTVTLKTFSLSGR